MGAEDIFVDNGTLRHTQYVHRAAMAGLEHGRRYEYRVATVGESGGEPRFCNETFEFVALFPSASDPTSLTVFGDMGWWNNRVFGQLAADAVSRDTDIVVHNGDMAYDLHVDNASVGDRWLNQLQPIASRQPYMVAQGNHEAIYDGLNYIKRFSMPNRTQAHNLWYSFDHGNAHCLVFTSEAYFEMLDHRWPELGRDSWGPYPDWVRAQRAFIASDLASAAARRDSGTGPRWLLVFGHRAMYCSDRGCNATMANRARNLTAHAHFCNDLEPLFFEFGVDIVFGAHWHTYERLWPVYNNTVLNGTTNPSNPYHDARAPVHIIAGAAGCDEHSDDFNGGPPGPWSAARLGRQEYGYGKLRLLNSSHATWQQIRAPDGAIRDSFTIVKSV